MCSSGLSGVARIAGGSAASNPIGSNHYTRSIISALNCWVGRKKPSRSPNTPEPRLAIPQPSAMPSITSGMVSSSSPNTSPRPAPKVRSSAVGRRTEATGDRRSRPGQGNGPPPSCVVPVSVAEARGLTRSLYLYIAIFSYLHILSFMESALHRFKAEFFKALGHPLRLAVLDALRGGERSVGALVEELGAEQSSLSQQLAVLRQRGFVDARKEGTTVYYRVTDPEVYAFLDLGRSIFERQLVQSGAVLAQIRGERGVAR